LLDQTQQLARGQPRADKITGSDLGGASYQSVVGKPVNRAIAAAQGSQRAQRIKPGDVAVKQMSPSGEERAHLPFQSPEQLRQKHAKSAQGGTRTCLHQFVL
jgi:hypothetical protein